MKKKSAPDILPRLDFMPDPVPLPKWNVSNVMGLVARAGEILSPEESAVLNAVVVLIKSKLDPDDYEVLYRMLTNSNIILNFSLSTLTLPNKPIPINKESVQLSEEFNDDLAFSFDMDQPQPITSSPLPNQDKLSFSLKIQLRGIMKPPIWREVIIPANLTFYQLHDVIQILFGWDGSHIWQFQEKPYDHGYIIGPTDSDSRLFSDTVSDDADRTSVSTILKKAGDKMVYVYDFSDDWVHDISLRQVVEQPSDHCECIKWKSDNPIENIGGIHGLLRYREMCDPKIKLTKKVEREFLDTTGFKTLTQFREFMLSRRFDLTEVNRLLYSLNR